MTITDNFCKAYSQRITDSGNVVEEKCIQYKSATYAEVVDNVTGKYVFYDVCRFHNPSNDTES